MSAFLILKGASYIIFPYKYLTSFVVLHVPFIITHWDFRNNTFSSFSFFPTSASSCSSLFLLFYFPSIFSFWFLATAKNSMVDFPFLHISFPQKLGIQHILFQSVWAGSLTRYWYRGKGNLFYMMYHSKVYIKSSTFWIIIYWNTQNSHLRRWLILPIPTKDITKNKNWNFSEVVFRAYDTCYWMLIWIYINLSIFIKKIFRD